MVKPDRTRHDRLRALLPRAYATDPHTSALGVVLETLGDLLRDADRDLERALRDKWVATASGDRKDPSPSEPEDDAPLPIIDLASTPLPLELIGAALDLLRQPWEASHEAYRTRVRVLAPLMARGLATPRAIAAFALTSLYSEPCPILERYDDSTRGWGLPPGALARCRTCVGGRLSPEPGTRCPLREIATTEAIITDNPRTRARLRRRHLDPAGASGSVVRASVRVSSESLLSDRPEITLRIPDEQAVEPVVVSFFSLTTSEEIIVAHPLAAADALTLRAKSPHDPATPRHLQRWVDRPPAQASAPSRAYVVTQAGEVEYIDEQVFIASGSRFDATYFAGDDDASSGASGEIGRFAKVDQRAVTPELRPGDSTWIYRPLSRAELAHVLTDSSLDPATISALLADVPVGASPTPIDLTLTWWTRPPGRFRLRIPLTESVEAVLASGGDSYLRGMIERVRPVGVHPVIGYSQSPFPAESLEPIDRYRSLAVRARESLEPGDGGKLRGIHAALPGEAVEPDDEAGFIGVFDVTRFDFSRHGEVPRGQFNSTQFDSALFAP